MGYRRVKCELEEQIIEVWLNWNDFKGMQLFNSKGDKDEELLEFTFYLALRHHWPDMARDDVGEKIDQLPGDTVREKVAYMATIVEDLLGRDAGVADEAKKLLGKTSKSLDSALGSSEEKSGSTLRLKPNSSSKQSA